MAGIDIQGAVLINGAVDFQTTAGDPADGTTGDVTFGGTKAIAGTNGSEIGSSLGLLAPVPFPPQAPPFPDCTQNFSTNKIMLMNNPNVSGAKANGVPIVTLGSMFLGKGSSFPCQPITGLGTSTVIATTPVMLVTDSLTAIGSMNGAGFNSP